MRKRQRNLKKRMLEPVESSALCILCGHLNSWEGEGKTRGSLLSSLKSWGNEEERSRDLLEEFGRQLQFGGNHHKQEEERDGVGDGQGAMIDLMEVLWDKEGSRSYSWTLCWDCAPAIKRAVEERRRCLKVEERVNKLQQRILEELGKLKDGMGKFYTELKGVEGLLMNGRGGGGRRRGDFPVVAGGLSTADSLRKRILGAIAELQAYQSDLDLKFGTVTPTHLCAVVTSTPEVKIESQDEAIIKEESDDDPASLDPGFDMECDYVSLGDVSDNDDGPEIELGNNPPPSRKGFEAIANEILSSRPDSKPSQDPNRSQRNETEDEGGRVNDGPYVTVTTGKEYDADSGAEAEGVTDQDQDESDPESSSSSSPAFKTNNSDYESCDSDNSGSESDSDGAPSPPKKARLQKPSISGASTLKEMFALIAVRDQKSRNRRLKTPPRSKGTHLVDAICDTKYSKATGKLTVGEVELILDEELKQVQCGSCSFQTTWSEAVSSFNGKLIGNVQIAGNMLRTISDHIHSVHLDAFKCPTCGVRKTTRRSLSSHMRRFHQGIFPCDICGRPLANSAGLAAHKWLHMSEMEREEARRQGMKEPERFRHFAKQMEANPIFKCDICHKQFKTQAILRGHEKIHSGAKEHVICPVCGKSMLSQHYDTYHKIYNCPLEGAGVGVDHRLEVKCIHCPAVLKNRRGFRRHMARSHPAPGEERPHLCPLCGMSFKTKGEANKHIQTHDTERRWKCSRGCGKDFNVKLNWRRHEAKCGFSAGDMSLSRNS